MKFEIGYKNKTYHYESEADAMIGKKLGEKFKGEELSNDFAGYEFMITGASDKSGFPAKKELEGRSLMLLLRNPVREWAYPALTTYGRNNHSVRSKRWRYTRYADGSEELYDHGSDELEWTNLAGDLRFSGVRKELARWLPEINREPSPDEDAETTKKRMKEMGIQLP